MGYYLGKGGDSPIPLPVMQGQSPPPVGAGTDTCIEKCEQMRRRLQSQGVDPETVRLRYEACIAKCGGGGGETGCQTNDDCPAGQICVRGRCVPEMKPPPCEGGVLKHEGEACKPGFVEKIVSGVAWCCPEGGVIKPPPCENGYLLEEGQTCRSGFEPTTVSGVTWCCPIDGGDGDGDGCEGGYKLADNPLAAEGGSIWTDHLITEAMGFYRNAAHQGHYIHKGGQFYLLSEVHAAIQGGTTPTPVGAISACKKGYAVESINGIDWCCPSGGGGNGGGGDGIGGMFKFPDEMMELYRNLINRGGEFLGRRPGFSDPMMSSMFGRDFDVLRRRGAGQAQSLEDMIASQGLLGTGTSRDLYQKQAWETERGIGDTMRDLSLANELQKRKDLQDYTSSAQSIFGQGVNFNTIIEQLNAARRGESQGSMAMMLQYLAMLMNSWSA